MFVIVSIFEQSHGVFKLGLVISTDMFPFLNELIEKYFTCDCSSQNYGRLKIANIANLEQLTRNIHPS